jgi:hypothetical protein
MNCVSPPDALSQAMYLENCVKPTDAARRNKQKQSNSRVITASATPTQHLRSNNPSHQMRCVKCGHLYRGDAVTTQGYARRASTHGHTAHPVSPRLVSVCRNPACAGGQLGWP